MRRATLSRVTCYLCRATMRSAPYKLPILTQRQPHPAGVVTYLVVTTVPLCGPCFVDHPELHEFVYREVAR